LKSARRSRLEHRPQSSAALSIYAGAIERTQAFAKELVELKPDVIFCGNTPAVLALRQETRTIPIIFANLSDPVDTGSAERGAPAETSRIHAFEYSLAGNGCKFGSRLCRPSPRRIAL